MYKKYWQSYSKHIFEFFGNKLQRLSCLGCNWSSEKLTRTSASSMAVDDSVQVAVSTVSNKRSNLKILTASKPILLWMCFTKNNVLGNNTYQSWAVSLYWFCFVFCLYHEEYDDKNSIYHEALWPFTEMKFNTGEGRRTLLLFHS